jgi:hypothetical protein
MATNYANRLVPFVAPALPVSPQDYAALDFDKFNNILRLYFNQVDGVTQRLVADSNTMYAVYTVATLPSAVTLGKGARSFVSDALAPVFGSTVVTGGAVATPVYSDGTNWKVG